MTIVRCRPEKLQNVPWRAVGWRGGEAVHSFMPAGLFEALLVPVPQPFGLASHFVNG